MTTEKFKQLVELYARTPIEFEHLKPITVAQWLHETWRGTSFLAKEHNNFGGMMWRAEMEDWSPDLKRIIYTSPSDNIQTFYLSCPTLLDWIKCYWKFIDREPYKGWRNHAATGERFLRFIFSKCYAMDPDYVAKVLSFLPEAHELLSNIKDDTHSEGESMPKVDIVKNSPNKSARNATLTHICLHNTAGGFSGSVEWLCNPAAQASAHLVVSRKGETAQLVAFAEKAWHAGNANPNSIGIEIEATNSQLGMTKVQEQRVIEWCRFLMDKYSIKASNVIIHRMVGNTDCPVLIWPTNADFFAWRKANLEGKPEAPKPTDETKEPKVSWFELHRFQDGVGCVGYDGSTPVVLYKGKSSVALVDFLKRWGDHNVLVAPESKPWPGELVRND